MYSGVLGHFADRLLDLILPRRCVAAGCGARGAWLCRRCARNIGHPEPVCHRCALPVGTVPRRADLCRRCVVAPPAFDACTCVGPYRGALRHAIGALKYRRVVGVADALGERMASAWLRRSSELPGRVRPSASRTDVRRVSCGSPDRGRGLVEARGAQLALVVAVPGDPARLRERGVDHTWYLAEAFARAAGLPPPVRVLSKVRPTRPQVGLSAMERRDNVRGSMRVEGRLARTGADGGVVEGAVLIDDVVTTGATCAEAARALRAAGCHRIHVCAAARARPPTGGKGRARALGDGGYNGRFRENPTRRSLT